MEKRAAIPPTLPRESPTISYWQDPPDEIADLRTTPDLPATADVVVIGSGISGACIAYGLLGGDHGDTGLDVVMLESRQACSGATGRNGGHTKGASYRSFTDNANVVGLDEAIKIARLEYNNMRVKQAFAQRHNISCDLVVCDTVDVVYDKAQWDASIKSVEFMRRTMPNDLEGAAKYTIHSAEETREKFFCKGDAPIGAISYPAGSLSAYKLVIGILKLALAKGLNLQTHTSATKLEKQADGTWIVRTNRDGQGIRAKKVVLATNGYTGYLYPRLQSIIVPLRGQITAHRPAAKFPQDGLPTTFSFIYSDGYEYMITRPSGSKFAGDVVIGGGLVKAPQQGLSEYGTTDDTTKNPIISSYLYDTTSRYFGSNWGKDHPDGRIRREWTGIMGYSPDGFPLVGEIPNDKGLWISASFQGHGMVLCFLCADAMVQMMQGKDQSLSTWFPKSYLMTEDRFNQTFTGKLHSVRTDDVPKAKL